MFEFIKLNDAGMAKAKKIQAIFEECLGELIQFAPQGREMAIVKTKLEEACFFAKRAMALVKENQATSEGTPEDKDAGDLL